MYTVHCTVYSIHSSSLLVITTINTLSTPLRYFQLFQRNLTTSPYSQHTPSSLQMQQSILSTNQHNSLCSTKSTEFKYFLAAHSLKTYQRKNTGYIILLGCWPYSCRLVEPSYFLQSMEFVEEYDYAQVYKEQRTYKGLERYTITMVLLSS